MTNNDENKSLWKKIASSSYLGLLGIVIAIISLTISIIFYYQSIKEPELTYSINPTKTKIFKGGETSALNISYEGKSIKKDVTAIQIAIWNRGKRSIKLDHIIKAIEIYSNPKVKIIESSVRNISRDAIGFSLSNDDLEKGILKVNWKILEKNDGASIQIVYIGPDDIDFKIRGSVEGQKEIIKLKNISLKKIFSKKDSGSIHKIKSIGYASIALGTIGFLLNIIIRKKEPKIEDIKKKEKLSRRTTTVLFLVYLIFGIVILFISPENPPFPY